MDIKTCTQCRKELPLKMFSPKKGRPGQKSGLKSRCKPCLNLIARLVYYPAYDRKTRKQRGASNITNPSTVEKQCRDCGTSKPLTEFHPCCKNPNRAWHWQSYCKLCDAARHRMKVKHGYKRPEPDLALRLLESKLKSVVGNYSQGRYSNKAILFELTASYLRTLIERQTANGKLLCAVTGVELDQTSKNQPLSPSIDRIDGNKGYEPDNVRIVALFYNLGRCRWDDARVMAALNKIGRAGE